MENRRQYFAEDENRQFYAVEGVNQTSLACLPILSSGEVTGAVAFLNNGKSSRISESQKSLVNAAAQFLSSQID